MARMINHSEWLKLSSLGHSEYRKLHCFIGKTFTMWYCQLLQRNLRKAVRYMIRRNWSAVPGGKPHVCIVGSGPAGFYTAQQLLKVMPILFMLLSESFIQMTQKKGLLDYMVVECPLV